MKKSWIAAIAAGLFTAAGFAQTAASGSATGNASVTPGQATAGASANQSAQANGASAGLSSGTTLQAELTKSVDAKKAKSGEEVTAKLTQDVKSESAWR
jgi:hypothetical protein